MEFESELAAGRFRIPECVSCRRAVWPPSARCPRCLGGVRLQGGDPVGVIIEFSKKGPDYFCLAEFGAARIMARSAEPPEAGQRVRVCRCGIRDGSYRFEVEPV